MLLQARTAMNCDSAKQYAVSVTQSTLAMTVPPTKARCGTGLGSQSLAHTSMLPPSKWLLMVTLPAASVSCDLDPVGTTEPSAHLRVRHARSHDVEGN